MSIAPIDAFNGDFDSLSIAAQLRYGAIPAYPTSDDFQLAACLVADDLDIYAEAHWYIEAIRERRLNGGRLLEDAKRDINARVATRLYRRAVETR